MLGNTIKLFYNELQPYIDFDFIDCINYDQPYHEKEYHVYLAELKKEGPFSISDHRSIILKELSANQLPIYQKISSIHNPHLETVFKILTKGDYSLSINEFIPRPSTLPYHSLPPEHFISTRSLTLEQYIKSFGCLSEKEALVFLYQLCESCTLLHENHLVHGDISPRNILLTDRLPTNAPFDHLEGIHQKISVKLIDFDITTLTKTSDHIVTRAVGTLPYAAPEIIDFNNPTDRADIYSLGCIFYYMLMGNSPKETGQNSLTEQHSIAIQHIFSKCTASYELRYQNLSTLKATIQKELRYPNHSFWHVIRKIPGFRSRNPLKMLFAVCIYAIAFLLTILFGQNSIYEAYVWLIYFLLTVIFCFDTLHIGEYSIKYQQLRELFSPIRYLVKISIGIILLLLFISLI